MSVDVSAWTCSRWTSWYFLGIHFVFLENTFRLSLAWRSVSSLIFLTDVASRVTVLQPFKEEEGEGEEVEKEKEKEIDRGRCGITFYCWSHGAVSSAHSSTCFSWVQSAQFCKTGGRRANLDLEILLSAAQSATVNLLFSPIMLRSPTSPN